MGFAFWLAKKCPSPGSARNPKDTLAMAISRANGLDIHYEIAGAGPPLVLIHALPFDHNLWLYQVERLSARFRTVAMDLRGWGRSAKPRTPFLLGDMAR